MRPTRTSIPRLAIRVESPRNHEKITHDGGAKSSSSSTSRTETSSSGLEEADSSRRPVRA